MLHGYYTDAVLIVFLASTADEAIRQLPLALC